MFSILRVCVQCQKFNLPKFGRVVHGTSRCYTLRRRSLDYHPGGYVRPFVKPLLFTTTKLGEKQQDTENGTPISLMHPDQWWDDVANKLHLNKAFLGILAVNIFVFSLWRIPIPSLHYFMTHYFLSHSKKGSTVSMLLACFSHVEFWHLALNMLVLWSFMQTFEYIVGKDCTIPFYISAGVFSSLVSRYSSLIKGQITSSRGASGAIMGVITMVVTKWPDSQVVLVFFPFVSIPALWGLGGVVAFDLIGLIRGWRTFDHAAHLGGVLFAILYEKVFSAGVLKLKEVSYKLP